MEQLNEKIKGLVKKAEKSGMPYSILKKVYDRGMAAWKTGHRPGTTPQQWAFARVNSFVTKSSGTWGKADKDLADKVRGAKKESIENPKKAKDLIGQVREKLGKDADAGDYIKDFRKSKAPQFKGKSDKKIQKMAIAAYLDSKEEKDLEESLKLDEAVIAGKDYKYDGKGPIKISKKMYAKVSRDSKSMIKGKPYMMALDPKTQATVLAPVQFEELDATVQSVVEALSAGDNVREQRRMSPAARARRDALRDIGGRKKGDDDEVKATDADREKADRNIINKIKKAADVKNEKGSFEIKFDKGPARKVPSRLASLVLQKFNKLKPADKLKFQKQAEKSYADFLRAVKDMTK